MSTALVPVVTEPAKQKTKKKNPKRPARSNKPSTSVISKGKAKTVAGLGNRPDVMKTLVNEMLAGNAAIYKYLAALNTPGVPGHPPLELGEWLLDTGIYEFPLEFTLTAGAAGVVYCALMCDGWSDAGVGETNQYQMAVTPGAVCWTSGTNATATQTLGAAADANNVRRTVAAPSDLTLVAGMQFRCTANIVEVYPESVSTNTSGSIMLASLASPTALENSALNGVTYANIGDMSQMYVNHKQYKLADWASGETAVTHITPMSSNCLKFHDLPATASTSACPTAGAVIIGSGMQSGQVVSVRVWCKYEFSRATGRSIEQPPAVQARPELGPLIQSTQALSRVPHAVGRPETHAARPVMAMEAIRPQSTTGISSFLSGTLPALLSAGVNAAKPFLPGLIGKGIQGLMSLFG